MRFGYNWDKDTKGLGKWHLWFAWRPVKVSDQWVWLETVERVIYDYSGAKYRFVENDKC